MLCGHFVYNTEGSHYSALVSCGVYPCKKNIHFSHVGMKIIIVH